jgi:hypothetical protein
LREGINPSPTVIEGRGAGFIPAPCFFLPAVA